MKAHLKTINCTVNVRVLRTLVIIKAIYIRNKQLREHFSHACMAKMKQVKFILYSYNKFIISVNVQVRS